MKIHRSIVVGVALVPLIGACSGQPSVTPSAASEPATGMMAGSGSTTMGGGSATGSPGSMTAQSTQRDDSGPITVEATWAGPAGGATFDVKLDNHMVDLDGLDLTNAVLRNDRGEALHAQPWAAPAGGHHRAGILAFTGDSASFFRGATSVQLVLTGLGDGKEHTLTWTIGS